MLPDKIQEVGGCGEIFWLHFSVGLPRVQRALNADREQPAQMQLDAEDSPRQHFFLLEQLANKEGDYVGKQLGSSLLCAFGQSSFM